MASALDESGSSTAAHIEVDSDEVLEAVLDSAPLLMLVTDLQGTITHWRGMSIEDVGPEDAVGESMLQILDQLTVLHDGASVERAEILERVEAGETTPYTVVGDDVRLSARALPVFGEDGRVCGMLAIAIDVSERWKAEEELASTSELLSRVIEAAPVAIDSLGMEGHVRLWNPAAEELFGWSAEEVVGGPPPGLPDEMFEDVRREVREGRNFSGKSVRRERRDGTTLDLSLSAAPLTDRRGELVGSVGIMVDVTQKKAEEEARRQSQKMEAIGRLAGEVAHDFNNLLSVIRGFAELIQIDLEDGSRVRDDVQEIISAAERAERLTEHLLTFTSTRPAADTVVDLGDFIADIERMLERLVGDDVVLRTLLGDAPMPIEADPGNLEQVVLNLVVNAREAMPDGGKITISTALLTGDRCPENLLSGAQRCIALVVRDNGSGMSEQTRQKIFEPFFTTKEQGTGIGMSTVYSIVQQHDAAIEVESELGVGTEMRVYFPVADAAEGAFEESTSSWTTDRMRPRTGEVLVVDDERAVRAYVEKVLERHGYLVSTAPNAGEALMMCEEHPDRYELVLTDVVMPRVDGTRLRERLEKVCPGLRVAYMSGFPAATNGEKIEPDHLLDKPFTPQQLIDFVASHLESPQNVSE